MAHDFQMPSESILSAIDCGSTITQVALFGQVAGVPVHWPGTGPQHRRTALNDVMASVRQAIQQLSEVTGWFFLNDQGQLITPERQNGG